mgnify:CR=1 FL=1
MTDIPEDDLEETRAALAPTLDATAAILPWLKKPKARRFDIALNARWNDGVAHLNHAWAERHRLGLDALRPAIFSLYSLALETRDADCLRLGEALASAADRFDSGPPTARLAAALTATLECLSDPSGLEHEAFGERARHFSGRLEQSASDPESTERSTVLDHIFVQEAHEHLELLRDALAALPPDAYALSTEATTLALQAEMAELWGVMHLARQVASIIEQRPAELDQPGIRDTIETLLDQIATALAAIER